MYIRSNLENRIELVSLIPREGDTLYNGEIPNDFYSTFSRGKYLFINGEIIKNTSYGEASLPKDIPHRTILINAGISSIKDLPEDLTTIGGIGKSKADDIINYNK